MKGIHIPTTVLRVNLQERRQKKRKKKLGTQDNLIGNRSKRYTYLHGRKPACPQIV